MPKMTVDWSPEARADLRAIDRERVSVMSGALGPAEARKVRPSGP